MNLNKVTIGILQLVTLNLSLDWPLFSSEKVTTLLGASGPVL